MKTAQRILFISLELFNQYGEPNVSSVDIANELDISPGNLYYHFKGKELITEALFEMYQQQMSKILLAPESDQLTIEEFFYYLLLILECAHKFLFLYRNSNEICEKYPSVARGFKRILTAKQKVYSNCFKTFAKQGVIIGDQHHHQHMVELIGLIATQAPNYQQLLGRDIKDGDYMYQSLATILFAMAPYMNIERETFESLHMTIMNQQLDGSDLHNEG